MPTNRRQPFTIIIPKIIDLLSHPKLNRSTDCFDAVVRGGEEKVLRFYFAKRRTFEEEMKQ
jgi:hypothetical protein